MHRRTVLAGIGATLGQTVLGAPGTVRAQSRLRIYMITYRGQTDAERGYMDYFAAHNVEAEFIHRDINRDISRLPSLVEEIEQIKPDLVYTWGTPVTLGVVGRYDAIDPIHHVTNIPVVFALVAAPTAAGIMPAMARSGRNVTGAVHVVPLETQMRAMRSYRDFHRVAVLYSKNEQNSVALVSQLQSLGAQMNFEVVAQAFRTDAAGATIADGVEEMVADLAANKADWLYYLPDTFLGTIYNRVTPAARAAGLPTFGAAELAVRQGGALVGLVCRYYSVGQLAASKSLDILLGKRKVEDIPADTLSRFSLIINMESAKALALYPPLSMLNYAEII